MSQLVVSESVASCIANQIAGSRLGNIAIYDETLQELFNDPTMFMDLNTLREHFSIINSRFKNYNHKIYLDLKYKDVKVLFGSFDSDVIMSYTICM